jgi:hypothetical protein
VTFDLTQGKTRVGFFDRRRALMAAEFLKDGVEPADAMWRVMMDDRFGYRRWRGSGRPRPASDRALEERLWRLLKRVHGDVLEEGRAIARTILGGAATAAATTVARAAAGEVDVRNTRAGRLSLQASEFLLEGIGAVASRGATAVAIAQAQAGGAAGGKLTDAHRAALLEADKIIETRALAVRDSPPDALPPPDVPPSA